MNKLSEPVVGIIFLNKFVLHCYKSCAFSVSNTGKQQFTANHNIYQLSDKDRSVWMILICDVVFGLVYS